MEQTGGSPDPVLDDALRTGDDDEPDMTIGDKHTGDAPPDPDGDGQFSVGEADALLGGAEGDEGDGRGQDGASSERRTSEGR